MKGSLRKLNEFAYQCVLTLRSIILLFLYSSVKVAIRTRKSRLDNGNTRNCIILGNGPSLKEVLENGRIENGDYFAVNLFVVSDYFYKLKPSSYFVTDPIFFLPSNDRCVQIVETLVSALNKVDWEINVYIPNQCDNPKGLIEKINNSKVNFMKINTIQVEGFTWFRHIVYKYYLGMPTCQSVLHAALMTAINFNYRTIYLYGADHSWTKDLRVDETNVVCYGDRHVYNTSLTISKMDYNIAYLLDCYSAMFKSHYLIRKYADTVKVKIINKTKDSFIDAYERN